MRSIKTKEFQETIANALNTLGEHVEAYYATNPHKKYDYYSNINKALGELYSKTDNRRMHTTGTLLTHLQNFFGTLVDKLPDDKSIDKKAIAASLKPLASKLNEQITEHEEVVESGKCFGSHKWSGPKIHTAIGKLQEVSAEEVRKHAPRKITGNSL